MALPLLLLVPLLILLILALLVAIAIAWQIVPVLILSNRIRLPSPPSPALLLGHAKALMRPDMHQCWLLWRKQLGPTFKIRLPFRNSVMVSNAADVYKVYTELEAKSPGYAAFDQIFGDSRAIFNTRDKEIWKAQRTSLRVAFSDRAVSAQMPLLERKVGQAIKLINSYGREGSFFNAEDLFLSLAMDFISLSAFEYDLDKLGNSVEGTHVMNHLNNMMTYGRKAKLIPFWHHMWFRKDVQDFKNSRRIVLEFCDKFMKEYSEKTEVSENCDKNIISALIKMRESGMDSSLVLADAFTLFFAGQDTTGHTLTWTMFYLCKQSDWQNQIHSEVDVVFDELSSARGERVCTDFSLLFSRCPILVACLRESMRIMPVTCSGGTRFVENPEGFQLGDVHIPKGVSVHPATILVHRSPANWEDPDTYKPGRWLGENTNILREDQEKKQLRFVPFGAGPRSCIGMHMAFMEMVIVLANLFRNFEFQLVDPNLSDLGIFDTTLHIANPLLVKPISRRGAT